MTKLEKSPVSGSITYAAWRNTFETEIQRMLQVKLPPGQQLWQVFNPPTEKDAQELLGVLASQSRS